MPDQFTEVIQVVKKKHQTGTDHNKFWSQRMTQSEKILPISSVYKAGMQKPVLQDSRTNVQMRSSNIKPDLSKWTTNTSKKVTSKRYIQNTFHKKKKCRTIFLSILFRSVKHTLNLESDSHICNQCWLYYLMYITNYVLVCVIGARARAFAEKSER